MGDIDFLLARCSSLVKTINAHFYLLQTKAFYCVIHIDFEGDNLDSWWWNGTVLSQNKRNVCVD